MLKNLKKIELEIFKRPLAKFRFLSSFSNKLSPLNSKFLPNFYFKTKKNYSISNLTTTENDDLADETIFKDYSHISSRFIMSAYDSTKYLLSLPYSNLSGAIDIFLEGIFQGEHSRSKIITNLIKLQEDSGKQIQSISINNQKEINGNKLKATNLSTASEIYSHLKYILEFLDKGNRGLLTGDLSEEVIKAIQNSIEKYKIDIENSAFDREENRKNQILNVIYDEVCKIAFEVWHFKLPMKGIPFPDRENPRNLFERQLILEDESNEQAIEKFMTVYEDLQNFGLSCNLRFARKYIVDWFPNLTKVIKEEQDLCSYGDMQGDRRYYGPYLLKISSEKLSLLALNELMKMILQITHVRDEDESLVSLEYVSSYYLTSKNIFKSIGQSVSAQIIFDYEEAMIKEQEKEKQKEFRQNQKKVLEGNEKPKNYRGNNKEKQNALNHIKKSLSKLYFHDVGIPPDIQIKIGSLMVYFMKETIKIKNEYGFWVPLITPGYVRSTKDSKNFGVLFINENFLLNLYNKVNQNDSLFVHLDRSLPMIYKPAPWQDYEIGAYYQKPTKIMRINESDIQETVLKHADLHRIYEVLDLLSQTPWKINKKVLDVAEKIWEMGGGMGEIPKKLYDYQDFVYKYQVDESFGEKKMKLMKKMQQQRDIHSLRCDFLLKLNVAKGFSNISKIYFPHNVDFRGRVYPVPPHLNHLGADLSRGLLLFSEGKPIG